MKNVILLLLLIGCTKKQPTQTPVIITNSLNIRLSWFPQTVNTASYSINGGNKIQCLQTYSNTMGEMYFFNQVKGTIYTLYQSSQTYGLAIEETNNNAYVFDTTSTTAILTYTVK